MTRDIVHVNLQLTANGTRGLRGTHALLHAAQVYKEERGTVPILNRRCLVTTVSVTFWITGSV